MPKTDAGGIDFNLHALGLSRLGQKFHVGIAGADHDQRVALLHCIYGWSRAQKADSARGVRAASGKHRLTEQSLDDRATDRVGKLR